MKNVVIWGAGQSGRMLLNLLDPDMKVTAFCDNNMELHGSIICGVPVIDVKQLAEADPDCIFISILNDDACEQIKEQIGHLGVACRIISIAEFRQRFDIRLGVIKLISKEINDRDIPGAVAELGVYQGRLASEINRLFPERKIYLFDTFEGFDVRDVLIENNNSYSRAQCGQFSSTGVDSVYHRLPCPGQAVFRKGYFPDTARGLEEKFALVSLDADLYQPTYEGLKFFYPRMSKGGYIVLHDYNNSQFCGAGEAANRFCKEYGLYVTPLCDLHGSAVIVKTQ